MSTKRNIFKLICICVISICMWVSSYNIEPVYDVYDKSKGNMKGQLLCAYFPLRKHFTAGALLYANTTVVDVKEQTEEIEENIISEPSDEEDLEVSIVPLFDNVDRSEKIFPTEKLDAEKQHGMKDLCEMYDIPLPIMMSLAYCESSYNPSTIGPDGRDYGLCQIRDINHERLREKLGRNLNFMNWYDSIESSCYMINEIRERYPDASWEYILLCYNRGMSGAKKYVNTYNTTSSSYTRKVLSKAYELGWVE